MKYKFLFASLIFLTSYFYSYSQDILLMKTGDELKVKVIEVLPDMVKFKKWDNQAGPLYNEYKSKIFMIKYQNGTKDVFIDQTSNNQTNERKAENITVDKKVYFEGKWIIDSKSYLQFGGVRINEILITRNGNNFIIELNKSTNMGVKTMGVVNQFNNLLLFGDQWTVSLDANNNDNLLVGGTIFRRFATSENITKNNIQESVNKSQPEIINKPVDYKSFTGYLNIENSNKIIKIKSIKVNDEMNNISEAQTKILESLYNMIRLGKGNYSSSSKSDTLDLTVSINFNYRDYSTNTYTAYFSDCILELILTKKTSLPLYKKSYNLSNYALLSKGFSSKLEANRNLIKNNFNQTLSQFIIGNFPLSGEIFEVIEKNKKEDEAKVVKISLGRKDGLFVGFTFAIPEFNNPSMKPDIVVKEVFDDYALCKVLENEKKILENLVVSKRLKIKTTYKP